MITLPEPIEFQWDEGNKEKNLVKHGVANDECEETFFDSRKRVLHDPVHSKGEERFILIGATKLLSILTVAFTLRGSRIRIISARQASKQERKIYHQP